ncbi:MAG: hypothetical protein JZD41_04680 [Thermoproteus sp.]|nr:hypothetical protein [Thermoproteus sp.]
MAARINAAIAAAPQALEETADEGGKCPVCGGPLSLRRPGDTPRRQRGWRRSRGGQGQASPQLRSAVDSLTKGYGR